MMTALWARRLGAVLVLTLASLGIAVPQDKGRVPAKAAPDEAVNDMVPVQNVGGHTGKMADLTLGPTGRRLFTVGHPGEVAEWDTRSGERLRVWRFPREAYRLAYSRGSNQLAVATQYLRTEKVAVWLVDLATGEARRGPVVARGPVPRWRSTPGASASPPAVAAASRSTR